MDNNYLTAAALFNVNFGLGKYLYEFHKSFNYG